MSKTQAKTKAEKLVQVNVKVSPIERLAIEQRAAEGNTTMSRVARQAIRRGLAPRKPIEEDWPENAGR